jgi:hypothetical protein
MPTKHPENWQVTLSSFTFAAIMDSREDGGALSWMNVRLPGSAVIGGVSKSDFLLGAWVGGGRQSKGGRDAGGAAPAAAKQAERRGARLSLCAQTLRRHLDC